MHNFLRNYGLEKISYARKLIHSFNEFEKEFPKEEDSVEYFAKLVMDEIGVYCRSCFSSSIIRNYGSRLFRCLDCRKKGWIFSGTFFQKMRVAKLWNATIWLYERRIQFNSWQLAELCQVAYSSALVINRKIAKVISAMTMEGIESIPSEVFMVLFRKRSIETPAKVHPKFEQLFLIEPVLERQIEVVLDMEETESGGFCSNSEEPPGLERRLLDLLSDTPVHFDDLCRQLNLQGGEMAGVLTGLELKNAIVRCGGDYFCKPLQSKQMSRSEKERQDLVKHYLNSSKVDAFIRYAIINFHGFSRKYLQFYLAKFKAYFQDNFMAIGKVLRECLKSDSFSYFQMLEYVSPEEVAM